MLSYVVVYKSYKPKSSIVFKIADAFIATESTKSLKKFGILQFRFDGTYICVENTPPKPYQIRTQTGKMIERGTKRWKNDAFQRIARLFIQFVMICLFHCAIYLYTYNTVDSSLIRFSFPLFRSVGRIIRQSNMRVCVARIFFKGHNSTLSLHNIHFHHL